MDCLGCNRPVHATKTFINWLYCLQALLLITYNKKVLLRERKRHVRRVANVCSAVLPPEGGGYPSPGLGRYPSPSQGVPSPVPAGGGGKVTPVPAGGGYPSPVLARGVAQSGWGVPLVETGVLQAPPPPPPQKGPRTEPEPGVHPLPPWTDRHLWKQCLPHLLDAGGNNSFLTHSWYSAVCTRMEK